VLRRLQVLDEIGLGYLARPAGDDAVGRRGAADQDRRAPVVAQRRAAAVHSRRADDRPAFRRHREAADGIRKLLEAGHTLLSSSTIWT
jgi:hypothetical protein